MTNKIEGKAYPWESMNSVNLEQNMPNTYPCLPQVAPYPEYGHQKDKTQNQSIGYKVAFGVIFTILLSSCTVASLGWLTAQRNTETLQTANTILREEITNVNLQYFQTLQGANQRINTANQKIWATNNVANQQILAANNRLGLANFTITELQQKLDVAEKWRDYWWERAHPKEFDSLNALKAWLAHDDTDHAIYIFGSGCLNHYDCDDYAMALVYNALQDGYLISTQIVDNHMMNSTIIGNDIYLIEPQTDEIRLWGKRD